LAQIVLSPAAMTIPCIPFAPTRPLFLAPADSALGTFAAEAHALVERSPELIALVDADLPAEPTRA